MLILYDNMTKVCGNFDDTRKPGNLGLSENPAVQASTQNH